jgi:hypothetical protein
VNAIKLSVNSAELSANAAEFWFFRRLLFLSHVEHDHPAAVFSVEVLRVYLLVVCCYCFLCNFKVATAIRCCSTFVVHKVSVASIMSQSTAIPVNITLDGQNYSEWSFCVETALRGYGLAFHLTDDSPAATGTSTNVFEIKTWKVNDGKVMAAIVNSVKKSMIMSLRLFKTAR